MSKGIKSFAGVPTPSYLVINKISYSPMPSSTVNTLDRPMASGAHFVNRKYNTRVFTVEYTIIGKSPEEIMYLADDLADWLDYTKPRAIVFNAKPDMVYYGIVDNASDIAEFGKSGKGTFTITCYDPHGYGPMRSFTYTPSLTEPEMFSNGGNRACSPIIEVKFKKALTDFAIVSDTDAMYFGDPYDPVEKTPTDMSPTRLYSTMQSTNGWQQGSTVDEGIVAGTFATTSDSFFQADKNYGSYSGGWHGAAMIKDIGRQLKDFKVEARIIHDSTKFAQAGRVEIYMLDINGAVVSKISLRDTSTSGQMPVFKARAGNGDSGTTFVNYSGKTRMLTKEKVGKDTYIYGEENSFRNFYGELHISRRGSVWRAHIIRLDRETGEEVNSYSKTWTDSKKRYTKEVAAIQVHVGQYKDIVPTSELKITHLEVFEFLAKPTPDAIDYVFRPGDVLKVDMNTGNVTKNGKRYFQDLYPTSSFFKFAPGINGLSFTSPSAIEYAKVSYRERWL